jgi:hypothetical protein
LFREDLAADEYGRRVDRAQLRDDLRLPGGVDQLGANHRAAPVPPDLPARGVVERLDLGQAAERLRHRLHAVDKLGIVGVAILDDRDHQRSLGHELLDARGGAHRLRARAQLADGGGAVEDLPAEDRPRQGGHHPRPD